MRKNYNPLFLVAIAAVAILSWLSFQQELPLQSQQYYYDISMIGKDTLLARKYIEAGEKYLNALVFDSARASFLKALDVYNRIPKGAIDTALWEYQSNALFWAGYISEMMKDLEAGEKYLKACIDLNRSKFGESRLKLTWAYTKLGYIYIDKGDLYKAYELIKKAYQIRKETLPDSSFFMINAHMNLLMICRRMEKYDEAFFHLGRLQEIARKHKDKAQLMGNVWWSMADIYKKQGKKELYRYYFEKYEPFALKAVGSGLSQNVPRHLNLANFYADIGDYPAIIALLPKSIRLSEKAYGISHPTSAYLYNLLGNAFFKNHQLDSALFYHQQALVSMFPSMQSEGYLAVPSGMDVTTPEYGLRALWAKADILKWRYKLQGKNLNDLEAALASYQAAITLMDLKRTDLSKPGSKEFLSKKFFSLFEEAVDGAMEYYRRTKDESYLHKAFYFTEKSKALILLETVRNHQLDRLNFLPEELTNKENQLKSEIAYNEETLTSEKGKPDTLKNEKHIQDLEDQLINLNFTYDSLVAIFKKSYPSYFSLKHNSKVVASHEVQAHLPDAETAMLEYFIGDSTLVVFAISKSQVFTHSQRIDSSFFSSVNTLRKLLENERNGHHNTDKTAKANFEKFVSLAGDLYKTLLQPVLSKLDAKKLVIVPDGILGYLPFEILLTQSPGNVDYNYRGLPYLFLDYITRYDYSATLLLEPDHRGKKASNLYAGFAPEYKGGELLTSRGEDSLVTKRAYGEMFRGDGVEGLRFNTDEIEESGAFNGGTTFLGKAAQEKTFLDVAPKSRILHLAMHALTNDQEPSFSQLLFSEPADSTDDGKLHAYELCNLRLNADLVVLSACRTGTGKLQRGEGIMSLSRAFKAAGCPNIVMSLWKADDLSTKEIITAFFKNLKAGTGKDVALQQARKDFLFNAPPEMTHPCYWGTFVLIGDEKPVTGASPVWMFVAGGLVLAGLGFLGFRRRRILMA